MLAELADGGLAPNWAKVDSVGARPSSEQSADFGYDAIRVALYLIWSGHKDHPAVQGALDFYLRAPDAPTPVVAHVDDGDVTESSTYPGFAAVRDFVAGHRPDDGDLNAAQGYYPATLEMLSLLVSEETAPAGMGI